MSLLLNDGRSSVVNLRRLASFVVGYRDFHISELRPPVALDSRRSYRGALGVSSAAEVGYAREGIVVRKLVLDRSNSSV
jgi:hypothetical protein